MKKIKRFSFVAILITVLALTVSFKSDFFETLFYCIPAHDVVINIYGGEFHQFHES